MKPTFLVITPAYEPNIEYLCECIYSVRSQVSLNYNILHVVIFNGQVSFDTTSLDHLQESSFNYTLQFEDIAPIKGVSVARNVVLQKYLFDFCAFLDYDDLWPSYYLERLFTHYVSDSSINAISCKSLKLIKNIKSKSTCNPYLPHKFLSFFDLAYNCIGCPSGFSFRYMSGHPLFNDSISICEDYLFYLELYFSGFIRILRVNDTYFYYRVHDSQTTIHSKNKWFDQRLLLSSAWRTTISRFRIPFVQAVLIRVLLMGRIDKLNHNYCSFPFIFMCFYPPYIFGNFMRLLYNFNHVR